ncbi:hypothetical protein L1887_14778 [Cichorium endivia]|nr:hypothetical protein L1887_14778 [Cichorium endivia]
MADIDQNRSHPHSTRSFVPQSPESIPPPAAYTPQKPQTYPPEQSSVVYPPQPEPVQFPPQPQPVQFPPQPTSNQPAYTPQTYNYAFSSAQPQVVNYGGTAGFQTPVKMGPPEGIAVGTQYLAPTQGWRNGLFDCADDPENEGKTFDLGFKENTAERESGIGGNEDSETEKSEEEEDGMLSEEESSENFFGEEDEQSEWEREEVIKVASVENQINNVERKPPLEKVIEEKSKNEVRDTCNREPNGMEESPMEVQKEGNFGNSDSPSIELGIEQATDFGPFNVPETQFGPTEKKKEEESPVEMYEPIKERMSEKLKILLNRETPLKDKLASIEEKEKEKIEIRNDIDLEKRSSMAEKRITRSQSRMKSARHHRMKTRSKESSVSEGVAQRLEEVGGKCGFKKESGRGNRKCRGPTNGASTKQS